MSKGQKFMICFLCPEATENDQNDTKRCNTTSPLPETIYLSVSSAEPSAMKMSQSSEEPTYKMPCCICILDNDKPTSDLSKRSREPKAMKFYQLSDPQEDFFSDVGVYVYNAWYPLFDSEDFSIQSIPVSLEPLPINTKAYVSLEPFPINTKAYVSLEPFPINTKAYVSIEPIPINTEIHPSNSLLSKFRFGGKF
ncbi:uncharacterized protein ACNLHF_023790 [Anomaloglossus baeobatrachus]